MVHCVAHFININKMPSRTCHQHECGSEHVVARQRPDVVISYYLTMLYYVRLAEIRCRYSKRYYNNTLHQTYSKIVYCWMKLYCFYVIFYYAILPDVTFKWLIFHCVIFYDRHTCILLCLVGRPHQHERGSEHVVWRKIHPAWGNTRVSRKLTLRHWKNTISKDVQENCTFSRKNAPRLCKKKTHDYLKTSTAPKKYCSFGQPDCSHVWRPIFWNIKTSECMCRHVPKPRKGRHFQPFNHLSFVWLPSQL